MDNNTAEFRGDITSVESFFTNKQGVHYMKIMLSISRDSGVADTIPILIPEPYFNALSITIGDFIYVKGPVRSYRKFDKDEHRRLLISVFPDYVSIADRNEEYLNRVVLDPCFIATKPAKHDTNCGKVVCDIMLASNRGRVSDYIPTIFWNKLAHAISKLPKGSQISAEGRLQSRSYIKNDEERPVYELSVYSFKKLS